jgi:hypothetical protein
MQAFCLLRLLKTATGCDIRFSARRKNDNAALEGGVAVQPNKDSLEPVYDLAS